jgi:serine/threonine protein kinase
MSIVKSNHARADDKLAYIESVAEQFTDIKLIAKGGFGVIYGGIHKLDGNLYAIKHMRSKVISKLFQMQVAEVRMLSRIYHPNIVRYHNSWVDEKNGKMNLFLQMEFINHTLESYLVARYDGHVGQYALDIASGLVDAVYFLHVHMQPILIHGDITPTNIMLQYSREHCVAKLCDFGLASLVPESATLTFSDGSSQHGTITYQAPEYHTLKTTSVDVYSIGIVLFQIFSTFSSAMERCTRIRDFKECKTKTNTLLDQTMHVNCALRPSIDELRQYLTQHTSILQNATL